MPRPQHGRRRRRARGLRGQKPHGATARDGVESSAPSEREPLWKRRMARLGIRTPLARTLYLGVASLLFATASIVAIGDVTTPGPAPERPKEYFVAVTSPAMLFYCVFLLVISVQELWRTRRR